MKRVAPTVILVGLLASVTGCGSSPTTTAPTPITAPISIPSPVAPLPPPSPALPTAALVIEQLSVIVHAPLRPGESFWYEPRFLLRETSGNSGATIQKVAVFGSNGSDETGPGCWGNVLRVSPGGTFDMFYTDQGIRRLAYCAPESYGVATVPTLRLVVTFADDDGRTGTVDAAATVIIPAP
jgi:hypothetical protein